eukprot:TRINITY_DN25563_c0_g1_i1.p1 TRINITY_DN25563_c0_g1~~TRINITY_DN25563_c0_g1_i1.p1  ORF type:complete len:731 (+),score=231.58 TRINITY_DN25563_c0_g1_i1:82-2274(+)
MDGSAAYDAADRQYRECFDLMAAGGSVAVAMLCRGALRAPALAVQAPDRVQECIDAACGGQERVAWGAFRKALQAVEGQYDVGGAELVDAFWQALVVERVLQPMVTNRGAGSLPRNSLKDFLLRCITADMPKPPVSPEEVDRVFLRSGAARTKHLSVDAAANVLLKTMPQVRGDVKPADYIVAQREAERDGHDAVASPREAASGKASPSRGKSGLLSRMLGSSFRAEKKKEKPAGRLKSVTPSLLSPTGSSFAASASASEEPQLLTFDTLLATAELDVTEPLASRESLPLKSSFRRVPMKTKDSFRRPPQGGARPWWDSDSPSPRGGSTTPQSPSSPLRVRVREALGLKSPPKRTRTDSMASSLRSKSPTSPRGACDACAVWQIKHDALKERCAREMKKAEEVHSTHEAGAARHDELKAYVARLEAEVERLQSLTAAAADGERAVASLENSLEEKDALLAVIDQRRVDAEKERELAKTAHLETDRLRKSEREADARRKTELVQLRKQLQQQAEDIAALTAARTTLEAENNLLQYELRNAQQPLIVRAASRDSLMSDEAFSGPGGIHDDDDDPHGTVLLCPPNWTQKALASNGDTSTIFDQPCPITYEFAPGIRPQKVLFEFAVNGGRMECSEYVTLRGAEGRRSVCLQITADALCVPCTTHAVDLPTRRWHSVVITAAWEEECFSLRLDGTVVAAGIPFRDAGCDGLHVFDVHPRDNGLVTFANIRFLTQ